MAKTAKKDGITAITIIMERQWKVFHHEQVRMMLTGQVFSIMGNVATDAQIRKNRKKAQIIIFTEKKLAVTA